MCRGYLLSESSRFVHILRTASFAIRRFRKTNFVPCRNLLIYFNNELQDNFCLYFTTH